MEDMILQHKVPLTPQLSLVFFARPGLNYYHAQRGQEGLAEMRLGFWSQKSGPISEEISSLAYLRRVQRVPFASVPAQRQFPMRTEGQLVGGSIWEEASLQHLTLVIMLVMEHLGLIFIAKYLVKPARAGDVTKRRQLVR